jgi:adenylate cyclase
MNTTFQQQLKHELLFSERKRVIILVCIFSIAIAIRVINYFAFNMEEGIMHIKAFSTVWLFPVAILTFELFSLLYINRRIRLKREGIPIGLQYMNVALEICLPSLIILYLARSYSEYNVLQSPVILIYFIFIILSTLRLNFLLSVFCGILSALSYVLFSVLLYGNFEPDDGARTGILLFSGIAAGLVARQIRSGINNSLKEAEKRHKVENLFGQQISAEVAEKMLESDGKIESRRMTVSVMFIDIRDFTVYTNTRSPEEIVEFQNAFLSIVIKVITKHGGIVNQILGDGCMVTFGAPVELINPSRQAIDAGLQLIDSIESAIRKGKLAPTRIGIGVHTGEVVTGNIGTAERKQYSITGSTVILASRIEQLNKELGSQMLISEETAGNIEPSIDKEYIGEKILKGWRQPVAIYRLA